MSGQLQGMNRSNNQSFDVPDPESKLAQMLALYKTPASIRDMKNVFFYVNVGAPMTNLEPLTQLYNIQAPGILEDLRSGVNYDRLNQLTQAYYAQIGTEKVFDIRQKIFELLDIRIPKDKYVLEINLFDCAIETDTSGWISRPDIVIRNEFDGGQVESFYDVTWKPVDVVEETTFPNWQIPDTTFRYGNKQSTPQTLYCRIKELSNGEAYNWAVTNSGAGYSIDKSHQLVVRHGDIDVSRLTLEYGHVVFIGRDGQSIKNLDESPYYKERMENDENPNNAPGKNPNQKPNDEFSDFRYVDYNSEVYNAFRTRLGVDYPNMDGESYRQIYQGIPSIDKSSPNIPLANYNEGPSQPIGDLNWRPPYTINAGVNLTLPGATSPALYQGRPLLFNQQVSKLQFRFSVRIIHMF